MSVELGVVCPKAPDAEQVAQLVGPLMCMVWHSPLVHALIDDDRLGRIDGSYTIFALMCFELWCRRFIDV